MYREIESESEFVWKQIKFILMLPVNLILVLFRKREPEILLDPGKELFRFIFEPKATITLIILNIIMFIFEIFYLGSAGVNNLAFMPSDIYNFNIIPILASLFMHASIAHLIGNMIFLFIFGRIVEMVYGTGKFLLIYFGSAIISFTVSALFGQGGIGASGAIAGLISTAILIRPFYLTYLIAGIPLPIIIVGWLGIIADITGVLIPNNDNIGHFAHVGGYIAIAIILFLLGKNERKELYTGLIINLIFIALLAIAYYFIDFGIFGGLLNI